MGVEEEGEPRRELVHSQAALQRRLDVGEAVGQGEGQLLRRGRAGLADVVARDRDRMEERHLPGAELDHVADEPHRGLGREDPLLLRDVLLEDVRLRRTAQSRPRNTLLLGDADVEGEQDRRRRVDRHRRRHRVQRDPREQLAHILQRVNGDALPAHLAEGARVIRVVAHQRRHVESDGEARLAVLEQVAEALVRLLRRAEPRELAHRQSRPRYMLDWMPLVKGIRRADRCRGRGRGPSSVFRGRRPSRAASRFRSSSAPSSAAPWRRPRRVSRRARSSPAA